MLRDKKKLKILFQEPFEPDDLTFGKFSKGAGNNSFPYGVASIAAYINERGHDVSYLDPNIERMSLKKFINYIKSGNFDLIGIGSTTLQIGYAISSFEIIKKHFPDIITVLGGVHCTLMPTETISSTDVIDYLILGEGEIPFFQLIEYLSLGGENDIKTIEGICFRENGSIILNPPSDSNHLSPEDIPIPLFDIFPMHKYVPQITWAKVFPSYSVIASRGCPFKCAFCNARDILGRKVRYKSVERLIEEIKLLKEKYGAKGLLILDSTFTVNKKWVEKFCKEYIKTNLGLPWACNSRVDTVDENLFRLMKEAGCWSVVFGIESANQKSLDLINKGTTVEQNAEAVKLCLELGFYVFTSYILCLPGETEEDALNTIRFARKMGNHLALFYLPIPFPKTKLSELCKETGQLREDAEWTDYNAFDFSNPVFVNPLIGKEKMKKLYRKSYLIFYSNPVVWFRNLKELILLRQSPYKYWLGAKAFFNFFLSK